LDKAGEGRRQKMIYENMQTISDSIRRFAPAQNGFTHSMKKKDLQAEDEMRRFP